MRPVPVKTQFKVPKATEVQSLKEKEVIYIMVGKELGNDKDDTAIQLNSDFVMLEEISSHLSSLKKKIAPENLNKVIVVMKIDRDIPMGLISDIKNKLREQNLLNVHYSLER